MTEYTAGTWIKGFKSKTVERFRWNGDDTAETGSVMVAVYNGDVNTLETFEYEGVPWEVFERLVEVVEFSQENRYTLNKYDFDPLEAYEKTKVTSHMVESAPESIVT